MDREKELKDRAEHLRGILEVYKRRLRDNEEALKNAPTKREQRERRNEILSYKSLIQKMESEISKLEKEIKRIQGREDEKLETMRVLDNLKEERELHRKGLEAAEEANKIARDVGISLGDFKAMLHNMDLTLREYKKFLVSQLMDHKSFYEWYKEPEWNLELQKRIKDYRKFKKEQQESSGFSGEIKMR